MSARRWMGWAGASLIALAAAAHAQPSQGTLLNDNRDIPHAIAKVEAAVREARWDEAVERIQKMLTEHSGEVHRVEEGLYRGVRGHALSLLAQLPPEGRAAYDRRYDPVAQGMVRGAAGEAALEEVVVRYPFTRSADVAVQRLAALAVERGEPARAAYWIEHRLAKHPVSLIEPDLLALLAFAYRHDGARTPLERLAAETAGRKETVRVAGREMALAEWVREQAALLEAERKRPTNLESWPVTGGDWSQSRLAPFEVASPAQQWRREFPAEVTNFHYGSSFRWAPGLDYRGGPLPARFHPVVGEGAVYLTNWHMVYAFNLLTGEPRWEAGPLATQLETPQDKLQAYGATYHEGAVYAPLETPSLETRDNFGRYLIRAPMPRRALVKIDAGSGKILWRSDRPEQGPDALVNKLSLLSAPVVLGQVAYVPGTYFEGYYKYFLLAFDVRTGELVWHRRVGGGQQALNLFGRPYREVVGCQPALSGGRIYLCSNLGLVACLDALSGEILWARSYQRLRMDVTHNFMLPGVEVGWYARPPIVAAGNVLFAPADSRVLICLDAQTGQVQWEHDTEPREGGGHALVGVAAGKVFIAGRKLWALELATGKLVAAPTPLDPGRDGGVLGLGALTEDTGYLSVRGATDGWLVRFSTRDGRIVGRTKMERELAGHLVLAGNVRLVASEEEDGGRSSPGRLAAWYDWDEIRANLARLMEREPGEPFAANGLAAIHLQKGELEAAEALFAKALERAGSSRSADHREAARRARGGLFELALARARRHRAAGAHEEALAALERAESLAPGESGLLDSLRLRLEIAEARGDEGAFREVVRRIEEGLGARPVAAGRGRAPAGLFALSSLARWLEKRGQGADAVEAWMRVLSGYPDGVLEGTAGRDLAYRAIEALKGKKPAVYARWNQEAQARFAQARRSGSVRELEAILARYPNSDLVPAATLLLARRLVETDRAPEAREILLAFLRGAEEGGGSLAPHALYLLFLAYERDRMHAPAKGILTKLLEEHGEARIEVGDAQVALGEFARQRLESPAYRGVEAESPRPRLRLGGQAWAVKPEGAQQLRILAPEGQAPAQHQDRFFATDSGRLFCRRADSGEVAWWVQAGVQVMGLAWCGPRLVAWMEEGAVAAFEPGSGNKVWEHSVGGRIRGVAVARGLVAVSSWPGPGSARDGSQMTLLDASTGRAAWTRAYPVRDAGGPLLARRHVVAWSVGRPEEVYLLDLATGRWRSPLKAALLSQVAPVLAGEDRLVLPVARDRFAIHDLLTDREVAQPSLEDRLSGLAATDKHVLADGYGKDLEVWTAAGRRLWRQTLPQHVELRFLEGETAYLVTRGFAGPGEGQVWLLVALDLRSGKIEWQAPLAQGRERPLLVLFSEQQVVAQVQGDSQVLFHAIDKKSGKRVAQWSVEAEGRAFATLAGGRLVVSAGERIVGFGK